MGGKPAYVQYVSACKVNVQAPDITPGNVSVTVANPLGTSDPVTVTFQEFAPALFTWSGGNVVASRTDFTLAAPVGLLAGEAAVPATPGDVIILWGHWIRSG